jgi:hypothetical protein
MPGSVSDWDFSSSNWNLDTSTYISSPSSLRLTAGTTQIGVLCKYSGTTNIPQGQLVSQMKMRYNFGSGTSCYPFLHFRSQSPIGSVTPWGNGYYIQFLNTSSVIRIYRDGSPIGSDQSILNKPADSTQWNKYRLTWWSDPGGAGLIIRVEYWNGSSWVKMINDFQDAVDEYKTSSLNRVGIGQAINYVWFDDTEIWSA